MLKALPIAGLLCIVMIGACNVKKTNKSMDANNPLLCDPEKGVCEIPTANPTTDSIKINTGKRPVKVIYFTDPICSSCWGIEPQLRKLKLEYGHEIDIEYHMGGLLPDWSYNSGGISKPSDVAHHWDEVSKYYEMPIDGDIWLEDPLNSSYPPSITFKAAQIQSEDKAVEFLRVIREMVFLEKKNITKWEHLVTAAAKVGLDTVKLHQDNESLAKDLFQQDLNLAKQMGVRGFPSVFFTDSTGKSEFVYGFKPYSTFETSLLKIYPKAEKKYFDKSWEKLFDKFPTLTSKEYAELKGINFQESEKELDKLFEQKQLYKLVTKNGNLWRKSKLD